MNVRSRTLGRSLNDEYTRAVAAWCSGQHWFVVRLNRNQLVPSLDEELIQNGQFAPVVVEREEVDEQPVYLVGGHALTVWREWFRSSQGFETVRMQLEAQRVPMIGATSPMGGGPETVTSATYGWLGVQEAQICGSGGRG